MTDYPHEWEADVVLSDGSTVHLRPIRPDDADRIVALHGRLSERTRYLRYFGPYPRIPPRDLARFTVVDHNGRVALVAARGPDLIAVARYDRLPGTDDAEVAFVVEDAYQGHGLGSILLEHLAAAARERGIRHFVADVLAENPRMARVFRDAGYQTQRSLQGGVVQLMFSIEPTQRSISVVYEREQRAEARSIERLLTPRSVAVVGASVDPNKLGHVMLANVLGTESAFTGEVYAVNPHHDSVLGVPSYPRVQDIPGPVELAVIAAPAAEVPAIVASCGIKGVRGLVIVSGGFAERGTAGRRAESELVAQARSNGMRVVGPNCLGVLNTDPAIALNATLAPVTVERGSIGFFCQSGALGSMTLQAVLRRGIGLSTFVSAGNRADVSGNDLLQFWAGDPATDVILLWLESFGNPRKFSRLARRVARHKPVAMLGRGPWSDIDTAGLQRLFSDVGVIWVDTLDELFDVGMLLGYQPLPAGPSVAVVGNSTAVGVLAADACAGAGLTVAEGYPVDLEPDADPKTLARAVGLALADPGVDSAVVVFVPPLPSAGVDHAEAIATVTAGHSKPVVSTFLGLEGFPAGLAQRGSDGVMGRGSIPSYPSPERAVHALAKAARYAQWRARPVGQMPELHRIDRAAAQRLVADVLPERRALTDAEVVRLLAAYGIDIWPRRVVSTPDDAVRAADELGYPVALTAVRGPGTASLDLADADEVRSAWAELAGDLAGARGFATTAARGSPAGRATSNPTVAGRAAPTMTPTGRAAPTPAAADRVVPAAAGPTPAAPLATTTNVAQTTAGSPVGEQIAVQSMAPPGVWTTLAVADDPTFGALVSFGVGGVTSELLGDRAYASVPMTDVDAARLVRAPRAAALLSGYRGAAPVELGALEELLLRLARLADDLPEVLSVELDPVLVGERSLTVLAAAVTVGTATARANPGPRRLRSVQTNQPTGSTTA